MTAGMKKAQEERERDRSWRSLDLYIRRMKWSCCCCRSTGGAVVFVCLVNVLMGVVASECGKGRCDACGAHCYRV